MDRHPPILVEALRNGTVESVHTAVAALADARSVLATWGDASFATFWRSAAKPLQAQTWIDDGSFAATGWGEAELALICGSHDGGEGPTRLATRMLTDLGLDAEALYCGGPEHMCSGNHIGFLAGCVHHGWDSPTYTAADHPAQLAALWRFEAAAGGDAPTAVDGCGILTYATSVERAATVWAGLSGTCPEVAGAMRTYPESVAGEGELDTEVMRALPGSLSKEGAEGLACFTLPDGRGLAVKVLDGAERAIAPAAISALVQVLGLDQPPMSLGRFLIPERTNRDGAVVGRMRVL